MTKTKPFLSTFAVCLWLGSILTSRGDETAGNEAPRFTPLTRATRLEKFGEAKTLIKPEWINTPDRGRYHPLTYAAYTANNDLIRALLEAGSDPNVIEANGKSALYVTANLANISGLELLKEHGAKIQGGDALSPAVAAVHSGSLECLEALLRIFPEAELDRGWENRTIGGTLLSDSPGDPVSYAAYHGYDEMALYLLSKGARIVGRDTMLQNALHHAAINPQCSVELVAKLVEHGCPPLSQSSVPRIRESYTRQMPRTPLDYASLAGNFAKVQAMVSSLDPKIHKDGIRSAAHLAAAYRRDKIATYLFGFLGEQLPNYAEFVGQAAPGIANAAPVMESDRLKLIMPRTEPRPGTMPASGTLAVISDPALGDSASLLSVELGNREGIQMVERDAMKAVIAEQSLSGVSGGDSVKLHNSLNLIPAKHVVIMSGHQLEDKTFVRITVVDTASGLAVATYALPADVAARQEGVKELATSILYATSGSAAVGTGVSLTPVTSETQEPETANLARKLNTLLPHLLGNTKGCAYLTRDQMRHLQLEKAIGIEGSYWAAAWVVDGGVGAIKDGQADLTLRAIHAVDKTEIKATRTVGVARVDEGLRECWNELVGGMKGGSDEGRPVAVAKEALEKEAQVLERHAKWLFEADYLEEAARLMDACLEMGEASGERMTLALMIQSKIATGISRKRDGLEGTSYKYYLVQRPELAVYGEKGMYAEMYHTHPRSCFHELRGRLLTSVDEFVRLGELAEALVRMKPAHENIRGWTSALHYDRDIEITLNPFVSNALSELIYITTIMDHTMILAEPANRRIVQDLGNQIEVVTTLYLDHMEEYKDADERMTGRTKIATLEFLLRRDSDYYALYLPKLFDRMTAMTRGVIEAPGSISKVNLTRLYELASNKMLSTREAGLDQAAESWWALHQVIQKRGLKDDVTLLSTAPLYLQEDRPGRLGWLGYLCKRSVCLSDGSTERTAIGSHPIGDLVCMDERLQQRVSSQTVESALLADRKDLPGTAEYLRMAALYRAIDDLAVRSEGFISGFLKRRPEIEKERSYSNASLEWSHAAWRGIREALLASRKLNPEIMGHLDKLAGVNEKDDGSQSIMDLAAAELLVLPGQPGHGQRPFHSYPERAAISGDELWLPGFSIGERLPWSIGETDSDNVIQVVSLKNRSTKVVVLPRLTHDHRIFGKTLYTSPNRRNLGRVELTKDYAYYTPAGGHLFYIRRDNHETGEIKISEGFQNLDLKVMDSDPGRNSLVVLAADRGSSTKGLRQVLLIQGDKVEKVLVSNRRKPEESPMDRPDFVPDIMEFNGNFLFVGLTKMNTGHVYDLTSGVWSELSKSKLQGVSHRIGLKLDYDHYEALPLQLYERFKGAPRGLACGYWHIQTAYKHFEISMEPRDEFDRHMLASIEVKVPPLSDPAFQGKWFPKALLEGMDDAGSENLWLRDRDRSNYKGWWITPDEAIRQGLFKAVIIGKWGSNYLMGLKCVNLDENSKEVNWLRQEYGVQAIWLLPASAFQETMKPLRERCSRLIDFRSAWTKEQWGKTAKIEARNAKRDFRFSDQSPVQMSGGGAVLVIRPVMKVEETQLVISISRRKWDRKIRFRFEVGDEKNPTEIYDSVNHEISTAKEYHGTDIYLPLPDGTKEIRLINESPRENPLRISEILFMPKKE